MERVDQALARLERALGALERAAESKAAEIRRLSALEGDLAVLNADRSRLAEALDQKTGDAKRMEEANRDVARRLVTAMDEIRAVLDDAPIVR
ncbi:MAG: DUF4164 family protein [Hyphomicrobiaceae bacterium]|nr:DUF4164 family protein [Hyphomicrobiaceae bacterium]